MKVSKAARARISDRLYGIFLEDINYGGDGGLYAELVPNAPLNLWDRTAPITG